MTFNEFIKKHNGKKIDYDGVCDVQCVDLAKAYLDEVCGVKAGAWGNAHAYFDNFNNIKPLKDKFVRIYNTPDFVPKKGDIMVWGVSLNGNWGHIAICDGVGDTTYFYSYDQNWTGRNDPCTRVRHTYAHVLGVLRPKDQSKILASNFPYKVKITAKNGLNIREKPSIDSNVVAIVKKGTIAGIFAESKGKGAKLWGKVGSGRGWISLDYVKKI